MIWSTDESVIKIGKDPIFESKYVMQRSLDFILEMLGINIEGELVC